MKKLIEIILDSFKLLIQIAELFTNFSMMRFRSDVQIIILNNIGLRV
jgi:hypothetical protein